MFVPHSGAGHRERAAGVEVAEVAADVDRQVGEDLRELVQGDVVAHPQLDAAVLGEDRAVRDDRARWSGLLPGTVSLSSAKLALPCRMRKRSSSKSVRLAYREADVAVRRVREQQAEVPVGLGEPDAAGCLERDVVCDRDEARRQMCR